MSRARRYFLSFSFLSFFGPWNVGCNGIAHDHQHLARLPVAAYLRSAPLPEFYAIPLRSLAHLPLPLDSNKAGTRDFISNERPLSISVQTREKEWLFFFLFSKVELTLTGFCRSRIGTKWDCSREIYRGKRKCTSWFYHFNFHFRFKY